MIARIQQLIALLLVVAVAGGFGGAAMTHALEYAAVAPLLIVAGYATVLAVEFWLLLRSYAPRDPDRPRRRQVVRAWAVEAVTAPRVFLWRQPFRWRAEADHLASTERRGVIFVHGFFCNRGVWNPWLRRLRELGIPCVAIDLEPVWGSIDRYPALLDTAARRLRGASPLAPIVVAHSMGGLAVRAWLAARGAERAHRVVTIATPHHGTDMASRGVGTNIKEMRRGSAWLFALAAEEAEYGYGRFICFWSHCDNIVMPSRSATLDGADNRHLAATPHVAMVDDPRVIGAVLALVEAADSPPDDAASLAPTEQRGDPSPTRSRCPSPDGASPLAKD